MKLSLFIFILALLTGSMGCAQRDSSGVMVKSDTLNLNQINMDSMEVATLGAGCFWCVEAVFQDIKGVASVQSGYSGGTVINPSYKEVCAGNTGHAEVVQITFDPKVVAFETILEVFFETHDPTTLNRQGGDVGTQYRSAVFYHSERQKELAELAIKAGNESGNWSNPIVTEVTAFTNFFPAEDYHQDYFNLNGTQPYCAMVIAPKVDKFKKKFAELLKTAK
ncbi:MAG: peptide-methionine (S)-S-oxide reductase MsrA [Flavobacteriales bacterium]